MSNSLTNGFDDVKDAKLGLVGCGIGRAPHYRHRATMQKLCSEPPDLCGRELAQSLYDRLLENWSKRSIQNNPSRQNWRFTRVQKFSQGNSSPEVTFERCLVQAADESWANQVPTSAGVFSSSADTRRSIDLVHRSARGNYDFIELKIASDTALYAAFEVMDYGLLYAFCRTHAKLLGYQPGFSPLLSADKIGLRVLAPRAYYRFPTGAAALGWLDVLMNAAAQRLAEIAGSNLEMDFRFECFQNDFSWDPELHQSDLRTAAAQALQAMEMRDALDMKIHA